jgi:hypothetical protein
MPLPNSSLQAEDICRRLAESGFPGHLQNCSGLSKFDGPWWACGQIAQEVIDRERLDHAARASGLDAILILATAVEIGWLGRLRDGSEDTRRQNEFSANRFFLLKQYWFSILIRSNLSP